MHEHKSGHVGGDALRNHQETRVNDEAGRRRRKSIRRMISTCLGTQVTILWAWPLVCDRGTCARLGIGARMGMHCHVRGYALSQLCIGTSQQRNYQKVRVHDQVRGEGRRRVAAVPAVPAGGMQAKKSV
jgi:hypothetical protein